jgi:hypothetical protein
VFNSVETLLLSQCFHARQSGMLWASGTAESCHTLVQQTVFVLSPSSDSKLKIASQATLPGGMRVLVIGNFPWSSASCMLVWSHQLESTHEAQYSRVMAYSQLREYFYVGSSNLILVLFPLQSFLPCHFPYSSPYSIWFCSFLCFTTPQSMVIVKHRKVSSIVSKGTYV